MNIEDIVIEELKRYKDVLLGKRVLVELPEGFKNLEEVLTRVLEQWGVQVEFRLEPSYGACETLACEAAYLGFQAVVHIGHYPYPLKPLTECRGVMVVYLPLRFRVRVEELRSILVELEDKVRGSSVAIAYIPQYEIAAQALAELLRDELGVEVEASRPILGCFFYSLEEIDVDAYLVLGSRFHAIGLGLATHGERRIILVDDGGVADVTSDVVRVLQVRYGKVFEARDARKWGIIVGMRLGQYRPGIVERVKKLLASRGFEVRTYYSSRTIVRDLEAIKDVDAFVVTSCPRIAIEDAAGYHKPVLTPGELYYLFGIEQKIVFPW